MLSSYFLTVVLSTLSRRRLYWSVYDPRATFTLDFYSDSRICNKRCCFLNKWGFIVRGTVSFQLLFMQHTRFQRVWRIKKFLILVEHCKKICHLFFDLHRSQKCLIHSLAAGFLHSVPVMLPEGLSSGRRTCKGKNVSKACHKSAFSKWASVTELTSFLLTMPIFVMSIVK